LFVGSHDESNPLTLNPSSTKGREGQGNKWPKDKGQCNKGLKEQGGQMPFDSART